MLNIIKYCKDRCNNDQYKKMTTSTNNPKMSTKMRYSEYIRSKPCYKKNTDITNT